MFGKILESVSYKTPFRGVWFRGDITEGKKIGITPLARIHTEDGTVTFGATWGIWAKYVLPIVALLFKVDILHITREYPYLSQEVYSHLLGTQKIDR